jgi:hypothetical protein
MVSTCKSNEVFTGASEFRKWTDHYGMRVRHTGKGTGLADLPSRISQSGFPHIRGIIAGGLLIGCRESSDTRGGSAGPVRRIGMSRFQD